MLKGKDLLTLKDLSQDELYQIFSKALGFKKKAKRLTVSSVLKNKTVALIFEKPSTRTRVSFEVAISHLGGYPIFLSAAELQLSRGEPIEDMGKVLSRYVDGIVIRTFAQKNIEQLAEASDVPVINGLSNDFHPCQGLADFLTILEEKDKLKGLNLAFIGDGNNVCNSLIFGSAKVGANLTVATPKGYEPEKEVVDAGLSESKKTGGKIELSNKPGQAAENADVIYTDVWTSMGNESEKEKRTKAFASFQINKNLLAKAKKDAIVMHCLPAHRGEEMTEDVLEDERCVVFDQAENRLHIAKAVLTLLLGD